MKHLRQRNKIFQMLINLPRGRICLKNSSPKTKNVEDDSGEFEQLPYEWQLR
jgi:hypothetical protein